MKIDAETLHDLLTYDPHTGELRWRPRALSWFSTEFDWKIWNKKFAGKLAGSFSRSGHRQIGIFGETHGAHRVIFAMMTGAWPEHEIDHIDHDPTNNRWDNLRAATRTENMKNQTRQVRNTSGVTGVRWNKQREKWHSYIGADGRLICLGFFTSLEEATAVRKAAERQYGYHENHGSEKKPAA